MSLLFSFLYTLLMMFLAITAGTSVTFQSSDGLWRDRESFNRSFEGVVTLFELYKIKCDASGATLERITSKPEGFSLEMLFNDFSDPKWLVPLAANLPGKTDYLSPYCAQTGSTESESNLAQERADGYIAGLKHVETRKVNN
ncbi:MAG: hypothetical protein OEL83_20580 [Desulforhopalus sp.]|nr:hypothetical protein [Desulforhopalus sp.]